MVALTVTIPLGNPDLNDKIDNYNPFLKFKADNWLNKSVDEDLEKWTTISLSLFDPTLCFICMIFLSLYVPIM